MRITIFDVEHGACALIQSPNNGPIALIDCGHNSTSGWNPADYIRYELRRDHLDYLIVTNADQDHYSALDRLTDVLNVGVFYKNPSVPAPIFRQLKSESGPLSRDALAYERLLISHQSANFLDFNDAMGGVTLKNFWSTYPSLEDFNDLSLAAFVSFGPFRILFPGDLEREGWLRQLADPLFQGYLSETTILVASHHGRMSGYCPEVFEKWRPQAVIVSDKPIVHQTQYVPQYQNVIAQDGILVRSETRRRRVLTTRNDGAIVIDVDAYGNFSVEIERLSNWSLG